MANISARALYDQKQREFTVEGAGLTRFERDFIDAANRGLRRINRDADLAVPIGEINDAEFGTFIQLDSRYEHVLSDLITIELVKMGQRPQRKEFELTYRDLVQGMPDQIDMIRTGILNAAQDQDTDEATTHIGMDRHS